jgi:hypothetical protein
MFEYKPGFIPTSFIVIGAGGTGGRLVPLLSQFLKTATWLPNPKIYIIDDDTVEDKNLVRQNFIKLDLGRPKAVVLAERYSKAFDVNIVPIVKKVDDFARVARHFELGTITDEDTQRPQFLGNITNAIVIMCVDSAQSRVSILNHLFGARTATNRLIIDAGNENDFGQILIYNDTVYQSNSYWPRESIKALGSHGLVPGTIPVDVKIPFIPFPTAFYENLKDADTRSCAELDQTLAINATMATTIMGIIQNFLYSKPIMFHKINISLTHGIIPEYITLKYLENQAFDRGGFVYPKVIQPRASDLTRLLTEIDIKIKEFKNGQGQTSAEKDGKKAVQQEVEVSTR